MHCGFHPIRSNQHDDDDLYSFQVGLHDYQAFSPNPQDMSLRLRLVSSEAQYFIITSLEHFFSHSFYKTKKNVHTTQVRSLGTTIGRNFTLIVQLAGFFS